MEWISVKDRLPDSEEPNGPASINALVYAPEVGCWYRFMGAAWYEYRTGLWYDLTTDDVIGGVTHWMPLPEPPKDGE